MMRPSPGAPPRARPAPARARLPLRPPAGPPPSRAVAPQRNTPICRAADDRGPRPLPSLANTARVAAALAEAPSDAVAVAVAVAQFMKLTKVMWWWGWGGREGVHQPGPGPDPAPLARPPAAWTAPAARLSRPRQIMWP